MVGHILQPKLIYCTQIGVVNVVQDESDPERCGMNGKQISLGP